jgi:hypothetical protein
VISGVSSPIPEQTILNPDPLPIDSTTGVLKENIRLNSSAKNEIKGKTVEDPTILMYFLASVFDSDVNNTNTKIRRKFLSIIFS